jgi:hypothetical protein
VGDRAATQTFDGAFNAPIKNIYHKALKNLQSWIISNYF